MPYFSSVLISKAESGVCVCVRVSVWVCICACVYVWGRKQRLYSHSANEIRMAHLCDTTSRHAAATLAASRRFTVSSRAVAVAVAVAAAAARV